MRTREEIVDDINEEGSSNESIIFKRDNAILELLFDVRDLMVEILAEIGKEKKPK